MWKDFSCYIINNYSDANKIVEVGVGNFIKVAQNLQKYLNKDIIMTDIKPCHHTITEDDVTRPDLKIYEGSTLIYSIRPPTELHQHLANLALKTGSDLIIKPLSTEFININKINLKKSKNNEFKLINYKKASFYMMCFK
ncbi:MAG: hypothetical protein CIT01_02725 [Methanobacterium sp. BRmetb2]|jgi:hypothetical protein|nr:MAG: hypothetical protein CIT01_02725 [Methanobacterium sp. BRmetb2]